jgi:hypothetical protein
MRAETPARLAAALMSLAVSLLLTACGKPSEEARIRDLLKRSVALAEKKDVRALIDLFAPGYEDFEGRDRDGTERLITDYLDRFRSVVIHLLGARVGSISPDGRAFVECEVSLSHGAAEILRKLIRYSGEYYHFRFDLVRSERGDWRFAYAEWRSIDLPDLFPESLEILRKLFPGL